MSPARASAAATDWVSTASSTCSGVTAEESASAESWSRCAVAAATSALCCAARARERSSSSACSALRWRSKRTPAAIAVAPNTIAAITSSKVANPSPSGGMKKTMNGISERTAAARPYETPPAELAAMIAST